MIASSHSYSAEDDIGAAISTLGPNKQGTLLAIADVLRDVRASITNISGHKLGMTRLFGVLVEFTLKRGAMETLKDRILDYPILHKQNLRLVEGVVEQRKSILRAKPQVYIFDLLAFDEPGIVAEILEPLTQKFWADVTVVSSSLRELPASEAAESPESMPLSGTPMFRLQVRVEFPADISVDELVHEIDVLERQQGWDVEYMPATQNDATAHQRAA